MSILSMLLFEYYISINITKKHHQKATLLKNNRKHYQTSIKAIVKTINIHIFKY